MLLLACGWWSSCSCFLAHPSCLSCLLAPSELSFLPSCALRPAPRSTCTHSARGTKKYWILTPETSRASKRKTCRSCRASQSRRHHQLIRNRELPQEVHFLKKLFKKNDPPHERLVVSRKRCSHSSTSYIYGLSVGSSSPRTMCNH